MVFYIFVICSFIPAWVLIVVWCQTQRSGNDLRVLANENSAVEFCWTVIPGCMVGYLCYLKGGCLSHLIYAPTKLVLKVVGHQWWWRYELQDSDGGFDSVMASFISSVDKPLQLGLFLHHHLLVTSADVIHRFSIPYFNLKVDAIPGRINQSWFYPDRLGVFVGYCSELCGPGHAYMPIVIEVVPWGKE